jgi:hypothetical protein
MRVSAQGFAGRHRPVSVEAGCAGTGIEDQRRCTPVHRSRQYDVAMPELERDHMKGSASVDGRIEKSSHETTSAGEK